MAKTLNAPLDDDELDRLDAFLLDRTDDEESDPIAVADGDEGILDVSELDGFLTALVSGPNTIVPSRWLPAIWGDAEPVWNSVDEFQEIFGLIARHQNSIADMLLREPDEFEPVFLERVVEAKTYCIVDQWCVGFMRGVALDADAWRASESYIAEWLRPIRLWGTEEGWREIDAMSDEQQVQVQNAIPGAVRAIHKYFLKKRTPQFSPAQRAEPKVGRNEPCPCGSGKKYKQCCLH